jgi:hypothetical protein
LLAAASRRPWRIYQLLLRHLRLRHKTSAWAFGGPAGRGRFSLAGEEQLGICIVEQNKYFRLYMNSCNITSRRCIFGEAESLAAASRRRWRIFEHLLHRLRLRHGTSAWASGGPAWGRHLAGEDDLGRSTAGKSK